jgi:hypothetical protein
MGVPNLVWQNILHVHIIFPINLFILLTNKWLLMSNDHRENTT